MSDDSVDALRLELREFARERDWEQFHNSKNLAMALAGEVGELLEIFQWLTPEEADEVMDSPRAADVDDELADVAIYLLRLADVLDVDLLEVAHHKLERNRERFPPAQVSGRADVPPAP
jgi:dCTP diphosphatase